jgi:hypothetical protein
MYDVTTVAYAISDDVSMYDVTTVAYATSHDIHIWCHHNNTGKKINSRPVANATKMSIGQPILHVAIAQLYIAITCATSDDVSIYDVSTITCTTSDDISI